MFNLCSYIQWTNWEWVFCPLYIIIEDSEVTNYIIMKWKFRGLQLILMRGCLFLGSTQSDVPVSYTMLLTVMI